MPTMCSSSDHDGYREPATVRISDPSTTVERCTYCAEGRMVALIRGGLTFTVTPISD